VALGVFTGQNQTIGNDNVYIGQGIFGVAGESNACYIKSIFGATSANGIQVLVNSSNKLGTTTSSRRFKQAIKLMDRDSEALFALNPVTFRYKDEIDPEGRSQFGLVAEDVENVSPDLIVRDKEGKPYSVRYDQVNAMLLNISQRASQNRGTKISDGAAAKRFRGGNRAATEANRNACRALE
jgi:Chaperone of endosialidase